MTVKKLFRRLARAFTCCLSKKQRNINESTDCYLSPVSRHDVQDSGTQTTTTLENVSDERVNIVDNNINKTVDGCEMSEKEVHELGMVEPNITDVEGAAIVEKSMQEEEDKECYLSPDSNHDMKSGTMDNEDSGTKTTTTLENVSDERVNIVDNNINKTVDGCEMLEKEVHELGMTEPNITDIEGAAIVEKKDMECYLRPVKTRRFKKGTICFFGKKKNSGTITTDNGQCYKFYKEDLNLGFDRRFKYPLKVKFVVDDSQSKWAYDVEIIGDPYVQRCYYCLNDDHLGLEDCMKLQIDSYNFYYPYI
ncbi:uncharacterized protein LOC126907644 [Daktulosphaira vitifoliae]|uniref:uncharacterized protein LOC126907644 n=1 Tax=Daktulosphaira vitifoliae TaxID=58002 RepID=UPI0021A9CF2F|nr:uncharacterized protein LOC126907644 [Daktulosphaira vitifoliae]